MSRVALYPLCALSQIVFLVECDGSQEKKSSCPFWRRSMGVVEPDMIELSPEINEKIRTVIKKVRSKKDAPSL